MNPDEEKQMEEIERQLDEIEARVEHMHQTLHGLERRNKLQLSCLSLFGLGLLVVLGAMTVFAMCAW